MKLKTVWKLALGLKIVSLSTNFAISRLPIAQNAPIFQENWLGQLAAEFSRYLLAQGAPPPPVAKNFKRLAGIINKADSVYIQSFRF